MRKLQSVGGVKQGLMAILVMSAVAGCGDRPPSQQQSLQQARTALAAKQYQVAGIALKSYLQAQPQDAEARLLLAGTLLESNDFVSAEKELRKALELGIARDRVEPMLARALIEQGEFKKLVQEIDAQRVNDAAARAEVLASLGRAYLGLGEQELASQQFVAALKLQPTLPAAMLGSVRILMANGELDTALRSLNDLLARNPQMADGLALRAGMLRERGQLAEATADYLQVLKLKPDDINARANLVMVLIDRQQISEAKQQVEQLRKRSPLALASNYLYALLAYRDGNYAEAHKYVEIALTGDAKHIPALFLAAATDYQLQEYQRAESRLRQVLEANPLHFAAQKLLMATYLRLGQPNRAAQVLPYVLRPGLENDADLAALAGEVFLSNRDFRNADLFFSHAAKLDPDSRDKKTALALARLREGKTEEALAGLNQAAVEGKSPTASRILVEELLRNGRTDQALQQAQKMVESAPDKAESHYFLASTLYAKGDINGARSALDRCLQIDPAYFPAVRTLASLDLARQQPKLAMARFEALLAKKPTHPQALVAMASLLRKQGGSPDSVLKLLERANNAAPDDMDVVVEMADAQMAYGLLKEADAILQKSLARKPRYPVLLQRAALVQYSRGDFDRAINTLFSLAETDRSNAPVVYLRIADLQLQLGKPALALQTLQKALSQAPQSTAIQQAYVRALIAASRPQDALIVARRMQQAAPKKPLGYVLEGDAKTALKDWSGALQSYRLAQQHGESGDTVVRLHRTLLALGKQDDARRLGEDWLKKSPADAAFLRYSADLAMTRGEVALASELYQKVLLKNPENVDVLNNSANALWQLNQRADALHRAEKAYAMAPSDADVLDTFGWMLAESGQTGRSIPLLQRAAALRPDDPLLRYHLGRALLADKQQDAAKSALEEALRLGDFPGSDEARRLLKAL